MLNLQISKQILLLHKKYCVRVLMHKWSFQPHGGTVTGLTKWVEFVTQGGGEDLAHRFIGSIPNLVKAVTGGAISKFKVG